MTEEKSCVNCKSFIPGEHHWCKDEKFTMYLFDISVCDEEFPDDGTVENIAGYYGRNCEGYKQKPKTVYDYLQTLPEDSVYRRNADLYLEDDNDNEINN